MNRYGRPALGLCYQFGTQTCTAVSAGFGGHAGPVKGMAAQPGLFFDQMDPDTQLIQGGCGGHAGHTATHYDDPGFGMTHDVLQLMVKPRGVACRI